MVKPKDSDLSKYKLYYEEMPFRGRLRKIVWRTLADIRKKERKNNDK